MSSWIYRNQNLLHLKSEQMLKISRSFCYFWTKKLSLSTLAFKHSRCVNYESLSRSNMADSCPIYNNCKMMRHCQLIKNWLSLFGIQGFHTSKYIRSISNPFIWIWWSVYVNLISVIFTFCFINLALFIIEVRWLFSAISFYRVGAAQSRQYAATRYF